LVAAPLGVLIGKTRADLDFDAAARRGTGFLDGAPPRSFAAARGTTTVRAERPFLTAFGCAPRTPAGLPLVAAA